MKNKRLLVATCVGLAIVCIAFICQSDDANGIDNVKPSQRTIDLNRGSLGAETWLEVEKNETVKICLDSKVRSWETSLNAEILNDSCLKVQIPTLIGVSTINVKFVDTDSSHKINLAIGMKYLDFKDKRVFLGHDIRLKKEFSGHDVIISGTYLVDKYPVTNCEFMLLLWNEIPLDPNNNWVDKKWPQRKKENLNNKKCIAQDTAANQISLFMAMKYANARSIREGLKQYYSFEDSPNKFIAINLEPNSKYKYIIGYHNFANNKEKTVFVAVDSSSDGYRLPFYDEWIMLAHGGDKNERHPWDSSATFKEISKYARFDPNKEYGATEPVGQLLPNGYGLYDIFGLVEEHVLFQSHNRLRDPFMSPMEINVLNDYKCHYNDCPSCLKGGSIRDNWDQIDYSYYALDEYTGYSAGFRLIRNIGNNAKWTEVKSDKE